MILKINIKNKIQKVIYFIPIPHQDLILIVMMMIKFNDILQLLLFLYITIQFYHILFLIQKISYFASIIQK